MSPSKDHKSTKPSSSRRNSVQQTTEVDRLEKVSHMNPSPGKPTPAHSTTSLPQSTNSNTHRMSMQASSRAMSTPSLSLNIPTPRSKFVLKHGEVVPEEEAESDAGSAVSSICQSPGWEQWTDSKKKKAKKEAKERKKEKEKADAKEKARAKAEAKLAEKHTKKLTKTAPSPAKRQSRLSFMMNRSTSAPTVAQVSAPVIPHIPTMKPWEEETENDERNKKVIDQAISEVPEPWSTAHGTPVSTTPVKPSPALETPPARLSNDIFIGGLKLKLAEEAYVQEKIRRQSLTEERKAKLVPTQDSNFEFGVGDSQAERHHESDTMDTPSSADGDSVRTPHQWESIYEQAAHIMRTSGATSPEVEDDHQNRNSRKPRKKTYPPTSYFPVEFDDPSSVRNSSTNGNRRDTLGQNIHNEWDGTGTKISSSAFSSDRPTIHTRDTAVDRGISTERSLSTPSHAGDQGNHSAEQSSTNRMDEAKAQDPNKPPVSRGRRMSLTTIKIFARNSSADAASTVKSYGRTTSVDRAAPTMVSANSRTGSGEHKVLSPVESNLHDRRSSSKNNVPMLQGIKHAARSAFGRATVTSPAEVDMSPKVFANSESSQLQNESESSNSDGSNSKAARFFGQPITAGSASPTYSNPSAKNSTSSLKQSPDLILDSRGSSHKGHHSRSTTDSSEEYFTHDESSNITTPMASTAASCHESSLQTQDDDLVFDHPNISKIAPKHSFTMTNAMPPKSSEQHPTAMGSRPNSREQAPPVPKIPSSIEVQNSNDAEREGSVSRSASPPDLHQEPQDLSFLPPLRHQPLTKPVKDKRNTIKPSPLSQLQQRSNDKTGSLIRPDSSPQVSKSRGGTSPTSPLSSQYLENARNSIGRPPAPRAGPDPIAKMFVVCCSCKYFHDMPSKIYECMAKSESVVEDKSLGVSGVVSTSVRCPWCGHGMTTACCAGYAAVVVLREKLH